MKINFQIILFVALFATPFFSHASAELIPEKLVLESTEKFGIVYTHQLKQHQTIYGLSKFFNTNMNLISAANPGVELSKVRKMQTVNIPINTDMLISERKLSPNKHYIPVFYTVKAKDNLFRISKVYFNQKIENVMKINKIAKKHKDQTPMKFEKIVSSRETVHTTPEIEREEPAPVQEETISSSTNSQKEIETQTTQEVASELPVENVELAEEGEEVVEEERELSDDPFEARNSIFKGEYEEKPTIHSKKIRAQWNSKSKDKVNLFALHATAKKGSFIEVYNPMLDRMVIAKVVGNIPDRIYKNNVELIVSPKVAETLGVVDKKFFVKIRFVE